jgi:hypothetical protein
MLSKGALRIQRLEGSRRDGRLCTLNGADRGQKSEYGIDLGVISVEVASTRRMAGLADSVEVTLRALKVG